MSANSFDGHDSGSASDTYWAEAGLQGRWPIRSYVAWTAPFSQLGSIWSKMAIVAKRLRKPALCCSTSENNLCPLVPSTTTTKSKESSRNRAFCTSEQVTWLQQGYEISGMFPFYR